MLNGAILNGSPTLLDTSSAEDVVTDLRADNLPSLAYHLSLGFTVVGVTRRQARAASGDVDVVFIERFLEEG